MTKYELKELCKYRKLQGYGSKNKDDLIILLGGNPVNKIVPRDPSPIVLDSQPMQEPEEPALMQEPIQAPAPEHIQERQPLIQDFSRIDHFEMAGSFTYVFEHCGVMGSVQPSQCEELIPILEIIDKNPPYFLVLENVKNIVRYGDGAIYQELKKELAVRGYFHRYRLVESLERGIYYYVVCLKNMENYEENRMAEEARISVITNPTIIKKYVYSKNNSSWIFKLSKKGAEVYKYIRTYVLTNTGRVGRTTNLQSTLLRQCFDFADFS